MQLIIDTTLPEIAAHLHTLRTRLGGDLTEPMSAVAALLENSSRKRFETQTDPDGKISAAQQVQIHHCVFLIPLPNGQQDQADHGENR